MIKKLPTIALILGVVSLICSILMFAPSGLPVSVAFGIMGIGCAIASKGDEPMLSRKAKTGLTCSIIGLVFGIISYFTLLMAFRLMSDPQTSKIILEEMQKIIPQMPESIQEIFSQYL